MIRKANAAALLLCLLAVLATFATAYGQQAEPAAADKAAPAAHCSDAEVKAEVPALSEFHEVIYPLWHVAWPAKDLGQMRELLPQIKQHVAAVQKAELPGILRDKKAKWDEGVAAVAAEADKLEKALAANEQQPALDAAEQLHARYEGLVRTIRPMMKELDAYHQVLYRVFHYDWPEKDLATLKTHAGDLAARCGELQSAAVPKRFAEKEAELKERFGALCAATTELKTAADGGDAAVVGPAVDKVHTAYQACEKVFD
jgi:hypothetical protein